MPRKPLVVAAAIAVLLVVPHPAFAQSEGTAAAWWQLVAAGLAFLVPVGVALVASAGLPQERAARTSMVALLSGGLGVLAYWAAGFALQFGGIGLVYDTAALRDLSWEWSLLDVSAGRGWGMAGLRGFFLGQGASTPHILALFVSHLPWVLVAAMLPALALYSRARTGLAYGFAVVMGGFLYPLFGNWVWGGGWLARLGETRSLGHGFVDFGGSSAPFLLAGASALAFLLLLRPPKAPARRSKRAPLPAPHFPFLAAAGLFLALAGSAGWILAAPQAAVAADAAPRALLNVVLGCLMGTLMAGFYSWFVTRQADPFMAARGGLAGLVAVLAAAPFMPPWSGVVVGAVAGLLLPLLVYLIDRVLRLADECAVVATFAVAGLLGTLAVGLLADGATGAGWNGVGGTSFLGVDGLGVTGLLAQVGRVAGWEGQLYAQLAGIGAAAAWAFAMPWAVGLLVQGVAALLAKASSESAKRGKAGSRSN